MGILLGLSGKPRSGKDTVGDYLVKTYNFKKYAFADYLKFLLIKHFEYSTSDLWGDNKTGACRRDLHCLGALLNEEVDSKIFVNKTVSKINKDYIENKDDFNVVITDVRRQEEIDIFSTNSSAFLTTESILDTGLLVTNVFDTIVLVKLERDLEDVLSLEEGLESRIGNPIETFCDVFDEWDYYLTNNNGVKALYRSVDRLIDDVST